MEITAKGKLIEEDYRRAMDSQQKKHGCLLTGLLGFFVFMFAASLIMAITEREPGSFVRPLVALLPLGLFGTLKFLIRRNMNKLASQSADHSVESEVEFSRENLTTKTNGGTTVTEWNNIRKIIETRDDFLIFPTDNLMWPVPKRFFATESDVNAMRNLAGELLGKKAKLQKS